MRFSAWLLCALLFSAFAVLHAEEAVRVLPGTPAWRTADFTRQCDFIFSQNVEVPSEYTGEINWTQQSMMKKIPVYRFVIPGQGNFYFSPTLELRGTWICARKVFRPVYLVWSLLCFVCAIASYVFLRRKHQTPGREFRLCLFLPLFTFFGLLLYLLCWNDMFEDPVDVFEYYKISRDMLSGVFAPEKPWLYTVGHPILLIPFALLTGAREIPDALQLISLFECYVLTPCLLVLVFAAGLRLTGKVRIVCAAAMLWIAFLFLFHYTYSLENLLCVARKGVFALPEADTGFLSFQKLVLFGVNANSDTPSACLILGCIVMALWLRRPLIPVSLLFGFACLVRMNNACFAPLLLFLLLWKYRNELSSGWKNGIRFFVTGALLFSGMFFIQLLVDKMQFGSFFTFPYSLHGSNAGKGFLFSCLPNGVNFLLGVNFAPYAVGLTGMLFLRNRMRRTFLALCILPLTVFFCGYPVVTNCGMRWLLAVYPFLFLTPFTQEWLRDAGKRTKIRTALPVILAVLAAAPCYYAAGAGLPLPWRLDHFSAGFEISLCLAGASLLFLLISMYLVRKNRHAFLFLGIFALIFYTGSVWILFALILFLLLRAGWDCLFLLRFGILRKIR